MFVLCVEVLLFLAENRVVSPGQETAQKEEHTHFFAHSPGSSKWWSLFPLLFLLGFYYGKRRSIKMDITRILCVCGLDCGGKGEWPLYVNHMCNVCPVLLLDCVSSTFFTCESVCDRCTALQLPALIHFPPWTDQWRNIFPLPCTTLYTCFDQSMHDLPVFQSGLLYIVPPYVLSFFWRSPCHRPQKSWKGHR